ncbi:ATP-binding protein [Corynebacterium cystitidis]|uniref:Putative ATP-dependent DNA helicase recG C-terminal n=1 Tax=Corynebacterium cystitidis DSM 20524 TaxID=1121357 RepID=A0A1H9TCK4_9CORY|nr:ATP-binding protein [Corynebacterium cystitidis]WJY83553.1 hypothetical protein CCYS_13345 [Corynebacterium cystitidis DSM 20524]SER94757.1 Putative ATP-dependent DNA helicase recG C-terminal [Corynebacterium cystitidis DSM 20524]SNV92127.1 putative transcriptional regulator [Corynebacterium cystitidis]
MQPIPGSTIDDLDQQLSVDLLSRAREASPRLALVTDDDTLLRLMQVVSGSGELTLAGNYALGYYPQGPNPALAVTVAERLPENTHGNRTRDLERFEGPVPDLLHSVMAWAHTHLSRTQRMSSEGEMRDEYEIPLGAVREAVANALVHRDLGPFTLGVGQAIDIRLTPDALIISSPGGLKGLTVEALKGADLTRREVNQRLYALVRHLRTADGSRIIEGEGGGVQTQSTHQFRRSRSAFRLKRQQGPLRSKFACRRQRCAHGRQPGRSQHDL